MVWLLAHPLPPSPVSKLDRWHRGRLQKRDGTGWARSRNIRPPGSLYIIQYSRTATICTCGNTLLFYYHNLIYDSSIKTERVRHMPYVNSYSLLVVIIFGPSVFFWQTEHFARQLYKNHWRLCTYKKVKPYTTISGAEEKPLMSSLSTCPEAWARIWRHFK
jgi:hypothetical protein